MSETVDAGFETSLAKEDPTAPAVISKGDPSASEVGDHFNGKWVTSLRTAYACTSCGTRQVNLIIRCPWCTDKHFHSIEASREHFDAGHPDQSPFREITLPELNAILGTTIRRDETSKDVAFICMLNAQLPEHSFNVAFSASSSTGKSYVASEVAKFFPDHDVIAYSGASPTAFFHEKGREVVKRDNQFIPLREAEGPLRARLDYIQSKLKNIEDAANKDALIAERKRLDSQLRALSDDAKILVNLKGKVVIFLDQPNVQLLEKLRSFLSHDRDTLEIPITDKLGHGGLRTKHVVMTGPACVIFATVTSAFDEQEATRFFILSPESSEAKVKEALALQGRRLANTQKFQGEVDSDINRQGIALRIELLRVSGIDRVIAGKEPILKDFEGKTGAYAPRMLRDFHRLHALIYGWALLNAFNREPIDPKTIVAGPEDVDIGFQIYEPILEPIRLGISPESLGLYKELFLLPGMSLSMKDLVTTYFNDHHVPISIPKLANHIRAWEAAGMVHKEKDPNDKRKAIFTPLYASSPSEVTKDSKPPDWDGLLTRDPAR